MSDIVTPSQLADIAVDHARSAHADSEILVIVEHDSRMDLRWARNTLTTNGLRSMVSATVIGFHPINGGVGVATGAISGPDSASIRDLVDAVVTSAAKAPAAEDQVDLVRDTTSGNWDSVPSVADPGPLQGLAQHLGEIFGSAAPQGIEHFGYAEQGTETTFLASTTGVRRVFVQPSGRVEMTAKSHDRTRSAWQGFAGEDISDARIPELDVQLRRALAHQARHIDIAPGRHRAILSEGAVADLMCEFWWTATARDAYEGRSVFSGPSGSRVGEQLTKRRLTIQSDPHSPFFQAADFVTAATSGSHASVFDNGLDVKQHTWLNSGTLAELIAPRAFAANAGIPAAASADCLIIEDADGQGTLDDLVAKVDDGLLVTCLWYNRVVDPQTLLITGLTRDGVYVVQGGEIIGCTSNFRFNDSPVGMLPRIVDASATRRTLPREMGDYVHRIASPAWVVEDFNFSTPSDAL